MVNIFQRIPETPIIQSTSSSRSGGLFVTLSNERGVVLAFSLLTLAVLMTISFALVQVSTIEMSMAKKNLSSTEASYAAEGSSYVGLEKINDMINTDMLQNLLNSNAQVVGNDAAQYYATKDNLGFLLKYVKQGNTAMLQEVNPVPGVAPSKLFYTSAPNQVLGNGTYQYTIYFTKKSDPILVALENWDFPFNYRIESEGIRDGVSQQIVLTGDFTVKVQKDNLARYALIVEKTSFYGYANWFIGGIYVGPVHSNDDLKFYGNPSAIFNDVVTQKNQKAKFYNNGSILTLNADSNPPYDVPTFSVAFIRSSPQKNLASIQPKTIIEDASSGPGQKPNQDGIYLPNDGSQLTGGIYVKGDASILMSVDANNNAVYQISDATSQQTISVDLALNQTTVTIGAGTTTYQGIPDGVDHLGTIIHVDGKITSFSGTVQKDTAITVSSTEDIVVDNHVLYQDYTPGVIVNSKYVQPSAQGTKNMLGLISWDGTISVSKSAPPNLQLFGMLMSPKSVSSTTEEMTKCYDQGSCADLNNGGDKGLLTHLGSHIGEEWGSWGAFVANTNPLQILGYDENNVYDSRTAEGVFPPYYPSLATFISLTNDVTDNMTWQNVNF